MSSRALQQWLTRHEGVIPAFDPLHDRATQLIKRDVASQSEIADVLMFDPGLASTLLSKVNTRLKKSRRPGVETIHTAFGHLGKPAVARLISQYSKLSDAQLPPFTIDSFRQLLNQGHHALMQLDMFARMQGISTVEDMRMAVLLHNIGDIYACLQDPQQYRKYVELSKVECDIDKSAAETFGFTLAELSRSLAFSWNLPEVLIESFDRSNSAGRKARLVQLAADIAQQAELGWSHGAMLEVQKRCADFLDHKPRELVMSIHQTAITAARSMPVSDVLHPAARLMMLPDLKPVAKQEAKVAPPVAKKSVKPPLPEQIKALLKVPGANQSSVLGLLLSGLQQDAGFSCTALMLLNREKTKLVMRSGKGIESGSAMSKLQIEVKQSGILGTLLQKPQALNVTSGSFKKYQSMLPGQFKAACMCDNFVIMSIFIGTKPVGIIYGDRQKIERPIDEQSYQLFKSSVMTASKALTFLVKRNTRSAA